MKTFPIILSAAMATVLVSCNQTAPAHYNGNGALAPAAAGDPLSAPQGATAPTQTQVQAPAPTPPPHPAAQAKRNPNSYPLAVKTPETNIVLSPHRPYNKVKIPKRFKSGDLVGDPDNIGKFFRVP